ncbi:FAD-dependent oxidoreductase [Altererythrobacter sp. KTW20L]|uniref:FAD-binding protein n=1 Tax=Altererythrobacter sp. KTW20L TaxID=2942210 RepID=UPI0020C13DEA|nr:FAD-dependent oxidoreductase [Altererythrobacter sp. KTW20L]
MDYDLVVIGCGAGGLASAVAYAEAVGPQARIAVLERATKEGRGGATRWTSSWFRITSDRQLDPEFVQIMERVSQGQADLDYCRTLAAEVPATFDFLDRHSVPWVYFEQPFANRNSGGGLAMPVPGGVAIVDTLAAVIDDLPEATILYETEATALATDDDGRVTGVHVTGPDGEKVLRAKAVVIACGGFEGAADMLVEHLGPRGPAMPLIAPTLANNQGDGIRLTRPLGGDVAGQFDMFHGEPVDTRSSKPDAVIYGYPFGILVNRQCQRFFDEGQDSFDATFERLGYEIWANQDQEAWFIGEKAILDWPHVADIMLTDQPPVEAETIEDLAQMFSLDPKALAATVGDYNAAIQAGEIDRAIRDGKRTVGIDPPKSNWATPISQGPFIGYPLTTAITFTFGGIRSDARGRVLRKDATAIPGLYAAGEVTGLYYGEYPAGTSVLRALTFGRIAAHEAAAER